MPPINIEYSTLIILLFLLVNTFFIIFIKKILDIKKIEVYKGVESEVKMTIEENIKQTKIRLEVYEEVRKLLDDYSIETAKSVLDGRIDGSLQIIKNETEILERINAKRNIL